MKALLLLLVIAAPLAAQKIRPLPPYVKPQPAPPPVARPDSMFKVTVFRGVDPQRLNFQQDSAARADTLAIKRLAAADGIDTTKVQIRVKADTPWAWHRRDKTYSIRVELRREKDQWVRHSMVDTTSASAAPPPPRKP